MDFEKNLEEKEDNAPIGASEMPKHKQLIKMLTFRVVPAYYKEIRAKYPSPRYVFAIENGTGKIIYKEGFSGGAGVGVSLPGGYINGAPKSKDVKKMKKNLR